MSRLHSGATLLANNELCRQENDFLDAIRRGDGDYIRSQKVDPSKNLSLVQNWDFVKRCAKLITSTGNLPVLKDTIEVLVEAAVKPIEIAEVFALETVAAKRVELTLGLLNHWTVLREVRVSVSAASLSFSPLRKQVSGMSLNQEDLVCLQSPTQLDVINTTIYYAANRKLKHSETLTLVESIIYYATVDQQTGILKVSICYEQIMLNDDILR